MKAYGDIESVNLATGERHRRVAGDGGSRLQIDRGFVDVTRLGPQRDVVFGPMECEPTVEEIIERANQILKGTNMHYRNGREAKNGDKIIQLGMSGAAAGQIMAVGVLYDAKPGNDYCNGSIAPVQQGVTGACMCDCLHVDDLAAMLAEKGLDKRPAGK